MINAAHDIENPSHTKKYQALPDEQYMSQRQLRYFESLLESWSTYLKTGASKTVSDMKAQEEQHADVLDQAVEEEKFCLEMRTREREAKLLAKIEKSMRMIRSNNGDYGYCKECAIEIGIQRLQARPTAELCVDCKGLMEIKER